MSVKLRGGDFLTHTVVFEKFTRSVITNEPINAGDYNTSKRG